jgi:hypothetical protein
MDLYSVIDFYPEQRGGASHIDAELEVAGVIEDAHHLTYRHVKVVVVYLADRVMTFVV